MQYNGFPDTNYTTTWSNGQGDVRFFTRADGSRLRYYTAGTSPPLVLIHTVRTQLELPTSDSAAGGPLHRLCAACEARSITRVGRTEQSVVG